MKAHFHINCTIDDTLLDRFMEFANNNTNAEWVIKLNTGGGTMSIEAYIRWCILQHPYKVTIIVWSAYSVGFKLIWNVREKADILFCVGCGGMFHYGTRRVDVDDRGKATYNSDEFLKGKVLPHIKKEHEAIATQILDAAQLKKFRKGSDIYFEQAQLLKIFPKAQIL